MLIGSYFYRGFEDANAIMADWIARIGLSCQFWCLTVFLVYCYKLITINVGCFKITCCGEVVTKLGVKKIGSVFMLLCMVHSKTESFICLSV